MFVKTSNNHQCLFILLCLWPRRSPRDLYTAILTFGAQRQQCKAPITSFSLFDSCRKWYPFWLTSSFYCIASSLDQSETGEEQRTKLLNLFLKSNSRHLFSLSLSLCHWKLLLVMLFSRAFRALFLRNLIYRKRNWIGTVRRCCLFLHHRDGVFLSIILFVFVFWLSTLLHCISSLALGNCLAHCLCLALDSH